MDLRPPVVVLAIAGAPTGCGSADLSRGEGECDAAEAGASEQQLCQDTETDDEQQTDKEDDGTS